MQNPKHLSELKPTERALVDQGIRDALLLVVHAQGKAVTIPIADAMVISDTHRLVVDMDRAKGVMTLRAEKAPTQLVKALALGKTEIGLPLSGAIDGGIIDPNAFNPGGKLDG